jgi:hypothetical protein
MAQNIELLIGIQDQIIKCRGLAVETRDPQASLRLHELADEVENVRAKLTGSRNADFISADVPIGT